MLGKLLRILTIGVPAFLAAYLGLAFGLTFWPSHTGWERYSVASRVADRVDKPARDYERREFLARDRAVLVSRRFAAESSLTLLLVHGISSHGGHYEKGCRMLRQASGAEVYAIDLRGHGASAGTPWDVDHIGQYEEDLSDVLARIRSEKPGGKIVLAGHSMGGGISLRYAMRRDFPPVDGYLLIAPALGGNSPTVRPAPDNPDQAGFEFRMARFLGLSLLTNAGIRVLNHLPVLRLTLTEPPSVYTYRAIAGAFPGNYKKALEAVNKPLLVTVGSEDEIFLADQYEQVVCGNSDGEVLLIEGENHSGITSNPEAVAAAARWMRSL